MLAFLDSLVSAGFDTGDQGRRVVARLRTGGSVAIACRGGIDRSGMTAACVLVEAGLSAEEAIRRVHAGRRHSLTRPEQKAYVRAWRRSS